MKTKIYQPIQLNTTTQAIRKTATRSCLQRRLALITSLLILGAMAAAVRAAEHDYYIKYSSIEPTFSGSFFDTFTGEWVDISGSVKLTADVTLGASIWTLLLNSALPANVIGTGRTTGCRYIANGDVIQRIQFPPNPTRHIFAQAVFKIFPPNPCAPLSTYPGTVDNFVVTFSLDFANDGTLLPQLCTVESCSGSSITSIGDTLVPCDPSVEICP
jgi:hypothetical protein